MVFSVVFFKKKIRKMVLVVRGGWCEVRESENERERVSEGSFRKILKKNTGDFM